MESKAKKKVEKLEKFDGLKEFTILRDNKYFKKGAKVRLIYNGALNFKAKKLI